MAAFLERQRFLLDVRFVEVEGALFTRHPVAVVQELVAFRCQSLIGLGSASFEPPRTAAGHRAAKQEPPGGKGRPVTIHDGREHDQSTAQRGNEGGNGLMTGLFHSPDKVARSRGNPTER